MKQNCWEFNNCGQGPGGTKVAEKGLCQTATDMTNAGQNSGQNAGRYCWKVMNCSSPCDFMKQVQQEEESNFAA